MTPPGEALSGVRQTTGHGGLAVIQVANPLATGEIYLHGASVTAYQPTGQKPVIFLSSASHFESGKAIRGGVPICWPWFGPHPTDPQLPQHGTARTAEWTLEGHQTLDDGATVLTLTLETPEAHLQYDVTFGRSLITKLTTTNHGAKPFTFTEALHTYLAVGDVRRVTVTGLTPGTMYFDRTTQSLQELSDPTIRFTGEYDRTYLDTAEPITVKDDSLGRSITVSKRGSASTVVWNPWSERSKKLADLGDDEWPHFVCIETANAPKNEVTLAPGEASVIESSIVITG